MIDVKQKRVVGVTYIIHGVPSPLPNRFVDPRGITKAFFSSRIKQNTFYTMHGVNKKHIVIGLLSRLNNYYPFLYYTYNNIDYRNNAHNTHAYMIHSITYERMLT